MWLEYIYIYISRSWGAGFNVAGIYIYISRSWVVGLNVAGITVTGSTLHKVNNKQRESN